MPSSETGSERPTHLLIVDDEPVILQILRAVFEDQPYRVTTVGSGADARAVIQDQGCDILVTDKNLPDIGGLDLLRLAKERDPSTEVIVVTGYGSLETAIAAMELGAYDYVLKPLNNIFDIRRKVDRALDRQRIARENTRLLHELKQKNEELQVALLEARELQGELIHSEKLAGIGTLAAGVAHEISSPLFGIMGLAEAILEESDVGLIHSYAREIVEYSTSIKDIVVELADYSRSSAHDRQGSVLLEPVARDALRLVDRTVDTQGIELRLEMDEDLRLVGRVNELQQIFVNLLKNAVDAVREARGAEGGLIEVRAGRDGEMIWCEVRDNGVGIPRDRLSSVFDPFYTTKPPGKGTGLGLNVVWRLVTRYRGTVAIESELGKGTTIRFRLPAQAP